MIYIVVFAYRLSSLHGAQSAALASAWLCGNPPFLSLSVLVSFPCHKYFPQCHCFPLASLLIQANSQGHTGHFVMLFFLCSGKHENTQWGFHYVLALVLKGEITSQPVRGVMHYEQFLLLFYIFLFKHSQPCFVTSCFHCTRLSGGGGGSVLTFK